MKTFLVAAALLLFGVLPACAQSSKQESEKPAKQQAAGASANPAAEQTQAKIDAAKEADIRRLLELTGVKKIMSDTFASMTQSMRPIVTNSMPPGEYRERLVDLFFAKFQSKIELGQLVDMGVVSYDKYFSHEEIKSLLAFYSTPIGQKTISVMPQLMNEMREAGRKWGEQLGRNSMQEVLAEHPDLLKALESAGATKEK